MDIQIVKNGSDSITLEETGGENFVGIGNIDEEAFGNFVAGIVENYRKGILSVIVTSGAVTVGRTYLWVDKSEIADKTNPTCLAMRQVCAAAGQPLLMKKYIEEFGKYNIKVAQILVTQETFDDEKQRTMFLQNVQRLLWLWIIPIINANDPLTPREIAVSDNDKLSTLVAIHLKEVWAQVRKLILLSNVEWLCDGHPKKWGKLIPKVSVVDESIYAMVDETTSSGGTWGMRSKVEAGEKMLELWIPLHIALGKDSQVLQKIARGESVGTVFAK